MATKVAATTAMALASRASRACDVCASKSARWYCGADAAFLCDRCDTQVHTANSLAQRHERVRLTPTGTPSKVTSRPEAKAASKPTTTKKKTITHSPPPQVLPARKRTRTSRPHPHRPRRAEEEEEEEEEAVTVKVHVKVEDSPNNLFADFFDTEDFLIDHPQEVPSCSELNLSHECSEPSCSLQSPGSSAEDCFSPGGESNFHGVSSDDSSFAAYFKGKAALTEDVVMSSDEFEALVPAGIDIICCDADGNISLAGDACFIPGDIPGLDAFDDCSLSFDLAASGAFEGEHTAAGEILASKNVETDQYATGPFAKYFVTKKATLSSSSPETIKSEAREILRCCTEGETAEQRPTLRLNYEEIIAAWSDRGEPWVNPECNAATDVGIVPDMGLGGACDDHEGADDGSSREARVMRYKEKRRSRLFSKTIRYEVRKLNAERRPRLKGRFVKRTNSMVMCNVKE